MNYLFDTNVICELVSAKPNMDVLNNLRQLPTNVCFLSVLTLGEIRNGVEKIIQHTKKQKITLWLEQDLLTQFRDRILPISVEVADRWGRLQNETKRTLPAIDSLLAATALHYDMTLVTRNTKDFTDCSGLVLLNPWS